MKLDERKKLVLSAVVDEYIKSGEPVGSHSVLSHIPLKVSSATVRNDMAYLEHEGLLEQPHTSAGRVPTYLGYRYYIDNLMSPNPLSQKEKLLIDDLLHTNEYTADAIVDNAVNVLSDLTGLAVVSKTNMPVFSVITRVEVIPAGRKMYALLMITSSGAIKNKICRIEFDLTYEQISFFEKFINEHLTGLNIEMLTPAVLQNLAVALGGYMMVLTPLLHAVYELSAEMAKPDINMKGEQKLLTSTSMKPDEVVNLLSHKNELVSLLNNAFDGISVVFGKENQSFAVTNSSMIMSPYKMGGEQIGSIGVIGPVRVDYAKIIPHIEYITNSVTKLLSEIASDNEEGKEEDNG